MESALSRKRLALFSRTPPPIPQPPAHETSGYLDDRISICCFVAEHNKYHVYINLVCSAITGKSQTEALAVIYWPSDSVVEYIKASVWDSPVKFITRPIMDQRLRSMKTINGSADN